MDCPHLTGNNVCSVCLDLDSTRRELAFLRERHNALIDLLVRLGFQFEEVESEKELRVVPPPENGQERFPSVNVPSESFGGDKWIWRANY